MLSLDPLLLVETLDIYTGLSSGKTAPEKQGFLAEHPMAADIQEGYLQDKSTGYADVQRLGHLLENVDAHALVKHIYGLLGGYAKFWTFSNRYEDGVIVSRHRAPHGSKY